VNRISNTNAPSAPVPYYRSLRSHANALGGRHRGTARSEGGRARPTILLGSACSLSNHSGSAAPTHGCPGRGRGGRNRGGGYGGGGGGGERRPARGKRGRRGGGERDRTSGPEKLLRQLTPSPPPFSSPSSPRRARWWRDGPSYTDRLRRRATGARRKGESSLHGVYSNMHEMASRDIAARVCMASYAVPRAACRIRRTSGSRIFIGTNTQPAIHDRALHSTSDSSP
jgi:hypothetical protein